MQLILGVKCVDSLESVMQIADGETTPPVSVEECVSHCSRDHGAAPHLKCMADAHRRAPLCHVKDDMSGLMEGD